MSKCSRCGVSPAPVFWKGQLLCPAHWEDLKKQLLLFLQKYPSEERVVFRDTRAEFDRAGKFLGLRHGQKILVSKRDVLEADAELMIRR